MTIIASNMHQQYVRVTVKICLAMRLSDLSCSSVNTIEIIILYDRGIGMWCPTYGINQLFFLSIEMQDDLQTQQGSKE